VTDVRVVVADDEPLVRRGLRTFIDAAQGLSLVGEARNGPEAVDVIRAQRPDLVFLDVQMPELDGFGVLDALEGEQLPVVVFVTAYDEYAIRAFDVHAVDYLLKPFDEDRFRVALGRVRSRLGEQRSESLDQRLEAVLSELRAREQYADRLLVKNDGRVMVVRSKTWIGSRRRTTTPECTLPGGATSSASLSRRWSESSTRGSSLGSTGQRSSTSRVSASYSRCSAGST
jgi:two-component system LytT family response regulator